MDTYCLLRDTVIYTDTFSALAALCFFAFPLVSLWGLSWLSVLPEEEGKHPSAGQPQPVCPGLCDLVSMCQDCGFSRPHILAQYQSPPRPRGLGDVSHRQRTFMCSEASPLRGRPGFLFPYPNHTQRPLSGHRQLPVLGPPPAYLCLEWPHPSLFCPIQKSPTREPSSGTQCYHAQGPGF